MGISNYALLMHHRCISSTRWVRLHKALTKVINFGLPKSGGIVPYVASRSILLKTIDIFRKVWEVRICIDNNKL